MVQDLPNAIVYGDLIMHIANQCRPYEKNKGDTDAMVDKWVRRITSEGTNEGLRKYSVLKKDMKLILDDFASIPRDSKQKVRVGIVGEIYIKFSPLGNNNLEDFLLSEDCEVVIPGFMDFCLYCINDTIVDGKMYGGTFMQSLIYRVVYWYFANKQLDTIKAIKKHGVFRAPTAFKYTKKAVQGYVSQGMNMGEGWLLTAEMLELIEQGVENIVCTQPFGCLPNHIVGRGMMKTIKERNPQSNIVSIDYDPGATKVNQENRIKLMLSNAKKAHAQKA